MAVEDDPEEVVCLPLVPVVRRVELHDGRHVRVVVGAGDLHSHPAIVGDRQERVHRVQFAPCLTGIVHAVDAHAHLVPKRRIVSESPGDLDECSRRTKKVISPGRRPPSRRRRRTEGRPVPGLQSTNHRRHRTPVPTAEVLTRCGSGWCHVRPAARNPRCRRCRLHQTCRVWWGAAEATRRRLVGHLLRKVTGAGGRRLGTRPVDGRRSVGRRRLLCLTARGAVASSSRRAIVAHRSRPLISWVEAASRVRAVRPRPPPACGAVRAACAGSCRAA